MDMIRVLNEIIEGCKAESGGGTYRSNCIEISEELLKDPRWNLNG